MRNEISPRFREGCLSKGADYSECRRPTTGVSCRITDCRKLTVRIQATPLSFDAVCIAFEWNPVCSTVSDSRTTPVPVTSFRVGYWQQARARRQAGCALCRGDRQNRPLVRPSLLPVKCRHPWCVSPACQRSCGRPLLFPVSRAASQ